MDFGSQSGGRKPNPRVGGDANSKETAASESDWKSHLPLRTLAAAFAGLLAGPFQQITSELVIKTPLSPAEAQAPRSLLHTLKSPTMLRSMAHGACFLTVAERLASWYQEPMERLYLQGLQFPGFYRRSLAEYSCLFAASSIVYWSEIKRIKHILTQPPPTLVSRWESYGSLLFYYAMVRIAPFIAEKALSEQIRRKAFKDKTLTRSLDTNASQATYLSYDRNALAEKLFTVLGASVVCYPLEVLHYVFHASALNNPKTNSRLEKLRLLAAEVRKLELKSIGKGFGPYFVSNLLMINVFLRIAPTSTKLY